MSSRSVRDGDPVRLECVVAGPDASSTYDVVWLHNEKEIKPSKDFVYKTEDGGAKRVLEIAEVRGCLSDIP